MNQPTQLHPQTLACPTCQRPWPLEAPSTKSLTSREIDAMSAWYHYRNVKLAAVLIGVGEQRAKNLLASARSKSGVHTNLELAGIHVGLLRSKHELMSHNGIRKEG